MATDLPAVRPAQARRGRECRCDAIKSPAVSLEPWSADQILALAPDAPSQRAGRGLATTGPWQGLGRTADPPALWGLCKGSGAKPYQACVDLTEPAYRCSCPS